MMEFRSLSERRDDLQRLPQVEGDTKPRERYEAIVVGAGLSGLACAAALANAGIRVRVLEARDRIGGRVFTIRDFAEGRPIEGGALMVHGRKNSVFRYAKSFDLGLRRIPVPWRTLFAMDGRARSVLTMGVPFLPPFGLQATYQGLFRLPRRFSRYQGANVPLERFLEDQGICRGARVLINFFYAHAFAADPDEIGVLGLAEEMKYQTGEWPWVHFQFVDGYNSVAERLAKGLDCVELRTKVTSIDWSSKGVHIEAETEKGLELYEADRAVVTVPLGVLKSGDIAFDPPLPQRKQRAIAGLGNGSGLITLILFDAALSTKGLAPFVFLGGESSTFFFKPLFGIKAAPTVLSCFTTGREAQRLATMSSQEAVDEILSELERLLPRVDFQNHLVGARVINWMQDPFARGVYSFPKAGGTMEMRTDLAAPLDNVLFFAGEATNFCGEAQTTNGAIDSGRRAASEVLLTLGIGSSAGDR